LRPGEVTSKRKEQPREFVGMNPKLSSLIEDYDPLKELTFNSDFESGNLDMVYKVKPFEYDLFMRVDTNTRGNQQWFYFSVQHSDFFKDKTVRFNIGNFTKGESLYKIGMRVVVSKKSQNFKSHKDGERIVYKNSNLVRRKNAVATQYYSQLSFDYTFTSKEDTVFFSYSFPYTFSKLQQFLREVSLNKQTK
jgi:cytosolic carboxypeptidase protein 2/3